MYLYPLMRVSENTLKWAMRLYPPLLFQRIWTRRIYPGFKGVEVQLRPCLFNKNYNGSIFGGTLFSAADPFYAMLFERIFKAMGYQTRTWLKQADIHFIRPVYKPVSFTIALTDPEIREAAQILREKGRFNRSFALDMKDAQGQVCVRVQHLISVRLISSPPESGNAKEKLSEKSQI